MDDPFVMDLNVSPDSTADSDYLLRCGPNGVSAVVHPLIRNPPRVKVRKFLRQTLPSSVSEGFIVIDGPGGDTSTIEQFVAWDIADYDVGGWFNFELGQDGNDENAYRLTVPVDGVYELQLYLNIIPDPSAPLICPNPEYFDTGTNCGRGAPVLSIDIMKKGVYPIHFQSLGGGTASEVELKAGDFLNAKVTQGSRTLTKTGSGAGGPGTFRVTEVFPGQNIVGRGSVFSARWLHRL